MSDQDDREGFIPLSQLPSCVMSQDAIAIACELQEIGLRLAEIGAALTSTLSLPLVSIGAKAVKAACEFESSFAGVRKA